jgi:hypothetical protein
VLHGARLNHLVAGSTPFSDDDAEESPEPRKGLKHFM